MAKSCPVESYHGRWTNPEQTTCSECGWTKPPSIVPADRKTFFEGDWRVFNYKGEIGTKCSPPTAEERARWAEEDAQSGRPLKHGERCPSCGVTQQYDTNKRCHKCDRVFMFKFPPITEAAPPGTKAYRIITQQDEFFGGKFDPVKLTQLMNNLALDGWRVVAITTADISTFLGSFWAGRGARQEIVVFMEKTIR